MPFVGGGWPISADLRGNLRAEAAAPDADRLVADDDATLGEQIFNIAQAEGETMIEPDGVRDDASRKTMAFQEGSNGVGFHPNSLHGEPQANNLTVPGRPNSVRVKVNAQ
jgi:hypothetical protein